MRSDPDRRVKIWLPVVFPQHCEGLYPTFKLAPLRVMTSVVLTLYLNDKCTVSQRVDSLPKPIGADPKYTLWLESGPVNSQVLFFYKMNNMNFRFVIPLGPKLGFRRGSGLDKNYAGLRELGDYYLLYRMLFYILVSEAAKI